MKHLFFWLVCILSLNVFAQHPCAVHKQNSFTTLQKAASRDLSEYDNYDVHYVRLDLDVDNLSTDINGTAYIGATITAAISNRMVLELHPNLIVSSATVNGVNANVVRENNELQISYPNILNQGDDVLVEIAYAGTPPPGNGFNSDAGIFNDVSPSWGAQVTWTLSQPFGAYTWWPCKQDLQDKIDSVDMNIRVPDNLKAGSNGILVNEQWFPGSGEMVFSWETRYPIDFYLISIAVGPYIDYSYKVKPVTSPDSILIQNFIYDNPNTLINFQNDIDETGDMMLFFSEIFGNYPFWEEKYGHCMAPLSGGMEHQTMTTQGFFFQDLTAHELGHQWFGDNVTCADWSHIWVNEGFASYSEYLYLESLNYTAAQNKMQQVHNNVMSENGGSVFVYDISDASRIFSSRLTYDKGAAILHSIRYRMGDALFLEALRIYQSTFKNGTATAEDFQAVIEGLTNIDFQPFFDHWYYGEGFPIFDVRWNQTGNDFVLELNQTGSVNNITPFFETLVEVRLSFMGGGDTTLHLLNSLDGQQYLRTISGTIVDVAIDPTNWIVNEVSGVTKDVNLVYDATVSSIHEVALQVSIYPNPVHETLHIDYEGSSQLQVKVFGVDGSVVGVYNNEKLINTSDWNEGVYFVQISNEAGTITKKILK